MATVLITGGTGLIGSALTQALTDKGHDVVILTRKARPPRGKVTYKSWDVERGVLDETALREADCIMHLAGANVAEKRWTRQRKQEIENSRVKSGELLVKSLHSVPNKVRTVISASAIGWYGPDPRIPNPRPFVETDGANNDFLGTTCKKWEGAIAPVEGMGKRLVIFRTGIVLSNQGGAYAEFRKPLRFGAAPVLGSGQQVVSWIHIEDIVRLYLYALENETLHGVYNAAAPHPVSNKELMTQIKKQVGGLAVPFHVPAFVLKIVLGEMSIEVLKSATVSSLKVEEAGFRFRYPTIEKAIRKLEEG